MKFIKGQEMNMRNIILKSNWLFLIFILIFSYSINIELHAEPVKTVSFSLQKSNSNPSPNKKYRRYQKLQQYYVESFHLSISKVLPTDSSVYYQTRDGTAISGIDYVASSGRATIVKGQTSVDINIKILVVNSNKNFSLVITDPKGANFPDGITEIAVNRTIIDPNSDISNKNGLGALIPTEEMLVNIPTALPPIASYTDNDLPSSYDLSGDMPPVRNQGGQGSCTAWAVGYYLKSYHEHLDKQTVYGIGNNYTGTYSPAFLYNDIKLGSCDGGSYIYAALDRIKHIGISSWDDMPYTDQDCNAKPSTKAINNAKCAKIIEYQRIRIDNPIRDVEMQDMKYYLSHSNPIVIGIRVYDEFYNPIRENNEFVYRNYNEQGYGGGHAILVVGYDDDRHAFKIINSWGKNWGNNGFLWIDYNVFSKIVFVAYRTEDALNECEETSDNTPPVFTSPSSVNVNENQTSAITLSATDKNSITYSISGTDENYFNINLSTGIVDFKKLPDYEIKSFYTFLATATDSKGNSSNQTININILNLDETSESDYFISTWKTDNEGESNSNQIKITTHTKYTNMYVNYDIDWGDGTTNKNVTGDITHTYQNVGIYTIKILGYFPRIYFSKDVSYINNSRQGIGDFLKILSVEQWGNIEWHSMESAFNGCSNLVINAKDIPNLSKVKSMSDMFSYAKKFNSYIGNWDTSNIEDMSSMFSYASSFNQDLKGWDVSNVTDMFAMFAGASSFNKNINNWDVSNVTSIFNIFREASSFNQPLNSWNFPKVTDLYGFFHKAKSFNQPLELWNTSNIKNMGNMFSGATNFNKNISSWNVSNVKNMGNMFKNTQKFNQDISSWNISNLNFMSHMFDNAIAFNQDISSWNTLNVRDMYETFLGASSFSNHDLSSWNVSNVPSTQHYNFGEGWGVGNTEPNWNN